MLIVKDTQLFYQLTFYFYLLLHYYHLQTPPFKLILSYFLNSCVSEEGTRRTGQLKAWSLWTPRVVINTLWKGVPSGAGSTVSCSHPREIHSYTGGNLIAGFAVTEPKSWDAHFCQGDLQFRDFIARDGRFVLTDLNIISMGFTNHKHTAGLHSICNDPHKDFTHTIKYCH